MPERFNLALARFAYRVPWAATFLQNFYRRLRPRFTVGAVGVLLDAEQRVFLVEHAFHSEYPWGLPGGWVDQNELPSRAVEREFKEETGFAVRVIYPLEVWSTHKWRNHVDLAFAVELTDANDVLEPYLSFELMRYQWASVDQLPRLMGVHQHVIQRAIAFQQQRVVVTNYLESVDQGVE